MVGSSFHVVFLIFGLARGTPHRQEDQRACGGQTSNRLKMVLGELFVFNWGILWYDGGKRHLKMAQAQNW
jgi:hypothetical protein